MTWSTITGAGTTTATKFFGDVMNKINNMLNGSDVSDTVTIHSNVTWTFKGSAFKIRDSDDSHSYTIIGANLAANRQITLPLLTGDDIAVTADFAQTLKNKTLEDSTTYFADNSDTTKKFQFQASGITTATTRTFTVPDFDATLATLAGNETFSNKTLTAPKIASGGFIADANGNELVIFTTTASAVNEATFANAATGNNPTITMSGSDSNVGLQLIPKGTGFGFGFIETIEVALSDDAATSVPTTGVKYTSLPMPADFKVIGLPVAGVKTAGTGATLVEVDILAEDSVNANTFTSIFSTRPTIDASEFTSTTAATPCALTSTPTTIAKGKRVQYKIQAVDSNNLVRGIKVGMRGYYSAV